MDREQREEALVGAMKCLTDEIALLPLRFALRDIVSLKQLNHIFGINKHTLNRLRRAGLKPLNSGSRELLYSVTELKRILYDTEPLPGGKSKFKPRPNTKPK